MLPDSGQQGQKKAVISSMLNQQSICKILKSQQNLSRKSCLFDIEHSLLFVSGPRPWKLGCQQLKLLQLFIEEQGMGNSQFEVPRDVRSQWVEQSKNGKIVVRNLVTQEIFQFLILSKLKENQNISKLIERSIYSIPKTPKIIILNDQQGQLFLLVQESGLALADYLQKQLLLTDVLCLLERTIDVAKSLARKYGPFHVRQNMIAINRNQDIMVWMNELRYKNTPSYPIENDEEAEGVMIRQILKTFKKHSRVQVLNHLRTVKSFEDFQQNIARLIHKKKLELMNNSGRESGKGRILVRAMSPQTSFGSQKVGLFEKSDARDTSSKAKQSYVVPKFIKNMKEKKNCMLDSLNHRRTTTIEQSIIFQASQKAFVQTSGSKHTSPSKSLNRGRITKMPLIQDRPLKNTLKSGYSSKNLHPQNSQICDNLTSSGSSNNCMINRRQFPTFFAIKSCEDLKPENLEKHNKTNSNPNSPNTTDKLRTFCPQNSESTLFESFQKVTSINPAFGSRVPLGLYADCVAESKYIEEVKNSEIIVQQESHCTSKTLEQEFDDFFSTGSRSPRLTLGIMNESHQLAEEFGKIIDF